MTKRSTSHTTFTIDRTFDASPARVFAAWATPELKARWFVGPESWKLIDRSLDFRVGGREVLKGSFASGQVSTFECQYQDIVPDQRIVHSYFMHIDDKKISVSLATVELEPLGQRTRVVYTEQAVFLDGYDDSGSRERGSRALLDQLAAFVAS
jgi:uncharacterized protein YndB with AHSA1/START domain